MSEYKITYKIIFELLAAFSICFSITWQVKINKRQYEWNKKIETLHVLQDRDRGHLRLINSTINTINSNDSLLQRILSDSVLLSNIKEQLTQFEDVSIGYNIGIYDKEVINKFMGTSFINFNKKVQPYIIYIRKQSNNQKLYVDYDLCVKSLSENK